jgi:hypothetical protein
MSSSKPATIGPHEGRELELMIARTKPLSMFVEPIPSEFELFPEKEFDALVAEGRLIKRVSIETTRGPNGQQVQARRVLYALPEESWRINAILLVQELYDSLSPGWRPDLERVIGLLLGYSQDDTEHFLKIRGLQSV